MKISAQELREEIHAVLGSRWETSIRTKEQGLRDVLPSPAGDIPRGALTEIAGPASSGRTSLLYSLLAQASEGQEFCTLLDAADTFDPASAAHAGVKLEQLLWVRCGGNVEHALKAADMLAQGGGFGLVAIDLGDSADSLVRRIPLAAWFRLRRAVENTKTVLVVLGQQFHTHSCAALKINLQRERVLWEGQQLGTLLNGFDIEAQSIRSHRRQGSRFSFVR